MAQSVKSLPAMRMTWVWSLSWEALLEKEMATHSSILVWRTPMDRGAWWATVHGVTNVGWDSGTNLHFSLSSYFELSNYSFSRNCFTLAKTKKKSQSANQSFQRKALLAASAAALRYPWGGCKLHLTYGGQPPPTLQSASRQGSSRGSHELLTCVRHYSEDSVWCRYRRPHVHAPGQHITGDASGHRYVLGHCDCGQGTSYQSQVNNHQLDTLLTIPRVWVPFRNATPQTFGNRMACH